MPTTLTPEILSGIETVIRQALEREFTPHSRPEVTINRSPLQDALEVRVRIFGDYRAVAMIDGLYFVGGTQFAHRSGDYPTAAIEHAIQGLIRNIRGTPAQSTGPRSFGPLPPDRVADLVSAGLIGSNEALTLLNAPDFQTYAERFENSARRSAEIALATRELLQDSRPAADLRVSEDGSANGVAPSRGDIGATSPSKVKKRVTPKSCWDRLLGDDIV